MPFLTLNGITIPTARGGKGKGQEIGERSIAFDGTPQIDRRAIKRQWKFKTPPLNEARFLQFKDMILGRGHYFQSENSVYASNGLGGVSGAASGFYPRYTAQGLAIYDENDLPNAKFGSYARTSEHALPQTGSITYNKNLLTAADSFPTTLWAAASGTRSFVTDHFMPGTTQAMKWDSPSAGAALTINTPVAATGSRTYLASVYVYTPALTTVTLRITNTTSAINTDVARTVTPGRWTRLVCAYRTPGAVNLTMSIVNTVGSGIIYANCAQLSMADSTSNNYRFEFPSIWNGTNTTVTETLKYAMPSFTSGFTVNLWATRPGLPTNGGIYPGQQYWSATGSTPGTGVGALLSASQTAAAFTIVDANVASFSVSSGAITMNNWHMITGVCRLYPETGEANLAIYFDGVLKNSVSNAAVGIDRLLTHFYLGTQLGTSGHTWNRMDEIQVLPYAVPSSWVSTVYAYQSAGNSYPALPTLQMSGNCIDAPISVVGEIDDWDFEPYYDASVSTWRDNGRTLAFSLAEV